MTWAIEKLQHESSHQRRSSREHARRAAQTTDQSLKDDYQTRAAQSLERARQCDHAIKILLAPRVPARARTADHGGVDLANAERQSRREATYSERSCSPGGPTC